MISHRKPTFKLNISHTSPQRQTSDPKSSRKHKAHQASARNQNKHKPPQNVQHEIKQKTKNRAEYQQEIKLKPHIKPNIKEKRTPHQKNTRSCKINKRRAESQAWNHSENQASRQTPARSQPQPNIRPNIKQETQITPSMKQISINTNKYRAEGQAWDEADNQTSPRASARHNTKHQAKHQHSSV